MKALHLILSDAPGGVGAGGSVLLRRRLLRGDRLEARHHEQLVLDQQDVSSVLLNRLHFWQFGNILSLQTSNGEVSNMQI